MERKNDFRLMESLAKRSRRMRLMKRGVALLSVLVLLFTMDALKRMAVAMERVPTCGYEYDHEHTDDCRDEAGALVCGLHEHTDACYQETPDAAASDEESPEEETFEEEEQDLADVTWESDETIGSEENEEGDEPVESDEAEEAAVEDAGLACWFDLNGANQALLGEVLAATELPVRREQIQMVGLVDDGSSDAPVAVGLTEQDVIISALRDFDAAEIAIVTADDIFTVTLLNGRAPAEPAGESEAVAEEAIGEAVEENSEEGTENSVEEAAEQSEQIPEEAAEETETEEKETEEETAEENKEEAEETESEESETEEELVEENSEEAETEEESAEENKEEAETEKAAEEMETEETETEEESAEENKEEIEEKTAEENKEEAEAEEEPAEENKEEAETEEESAEENKEEIEEKTAEENKEEAETEEESAEENKEETETEETAEEETEETETEEATEENKDETEEETTEENKEESETEEESAEENKEETEEATEGDSKEAEEESYGAGEEPEAVDIETLYPAQSFEDYAGNIRVNVNAGVGAFPADTAMVLTPVEEQETLDSIADTVTEDFVEVKRVLAVDIAFFDAEGAEIEPLLPIAVVMTVEEIEEHQDAVVVHMDDAGNAEVMEQSEASQSADAERALNVELPAAENADAMRAELESQLAEETTEETGEQPAEEPSEETGEQPAEEPSEETEEQPAEEPSEEIEEQPAEEAVEQAVEQASEEAVEQFEEAGAEEATDESEDVTGDALEIVEEAAPATDVAFEADAFSVYAVVVTETIETRYIAADGAAFNITVGYGQDAEIPAGAELTAREIGIDDEDYQRYVNESSAAISEDGDNLITFARFFDIEIRVDGEKIEPAAPVTLNITLDNTPEDTNENTIKVVHFDEEDGPVVMDPEIGEAADLNVVTDSFSVYGVVTYPVTYQFGADVSELVGKGFTIYHNGHYFTSNLGGDPARLLPADSKSEAAVWYIKPVGNGGNYILYTFDSSGQERQVSFSKRTDSSAHVVLGAGNGNHFSIQRYNNSNIYTFLGYVNGSESYYLDDWGQSQGLAGYRDDKSPNINERFQLDVVSYPTQDNKEYMVILQKGDNYYEVLNDGTLEKVEKRVIDGVEKFVVSQPMMWNLEKDSGENKYYINHKAFVKKTDNLSLPADWYYRYMTPSGNTNGTVGVNTETVMPVVKYGESTTYGEWEDNRELKINSAVRIDPANNVIQSVSDNSYLGVNEDGTGMTQVWNQSDAAKVYFATADQFQVELKQENLRPYNLVNHIDIEVNAKARLTVPLGNGKVYDANHNEITIPGDRILNLEEHVDVTPQDLKNATITAYTKNNGVKNYIDDAYTITGYSGNAPRGITDTQVRVEGRFLVSTYFNDKDSQNAKIFKDEDNQSTEELNKRYKDRVFYDISTKKKVTFYYTYKDPETNKVIDLYDANGKRLKTETIVELTSSFDYWDPLNACPVLHEGWVPEGAFVQDWKDHKIPHDAWGGSGMDFTIGADEEGRYKKPGILITKYIYDEYGNLIELKNDTTSEFDIWQRPIDGLATPNESRVFTNTVKNVNRGGEHSKPDDSDLYDTQEKQPSQAYDGFAKTHSVTVDVAQSGTGSKYDFSVESGMVYIQEKNVAPTILDKNGVTWEYVHTIIKTEYVKRTASDTEEDFHYTRVMTDKSKLNSVPDVVGRYFKEGDNSESSSDSLEFYVYNVYRPCKTSVKVHKDWKDEFGNEYKGLKKAVQVQIARCKQVPVQNYSYDNLTRARMEIWQGNYNYRLLANDNLRVGDQVKLTIKCQKNESISYSVNGGSYVDLPRNTADDAPQWQSVDVTLTIPESGMLYVVFNDPWNAVGQNGGEGQGQLKAYKGSSEIQDNDTGFRPNISSAEVDLDMRYEAETNKDGAAIVYGTVTLNAAGNWEGTLGNLEMYDENGNPYMYFILNELCDDASVIPIIGLDESGTVMLANTPEKPLQITNVVPSTQITIVKLKKGTTERLPGAVFKLEKRVAGSWQVVKDDFVLSESDNAQIVINRLFDGRYRLVEVSAPAGYIIRNQYIYFNISGGTVILADENGGLAGTELYDNMIEIGGNVIEVQNEPGARLPSTGGMGTGAYTAAGAGLVLLAIALLLLRKRAL